MSSEYKISISGNLIVAKYNLRGTLLAETSEIAQKFFAQLRSRIMDQFPKDQSTPFALLANRTYGRDGTDGEWIFKLVGMTRIATKLKENDPRVVSDPYQDLTDIRVGSLVEPGLIAHLQLDTITKMATAFTFFGNDIIDDVDIDKLEKDVDQLFYQSFITRELGGAGIMHAKRNYESRNGLYFWMVHNWYGATHPRDMAARVALSHWLGHPVDGNWPAEKLANELTENFGEDSCIIYLNDEPPECC